MIRFLLQIVHVLFFSCETDATSAVTDQTVNTTEIWDSGGSNRQFGGSSWGSCGRGDTDGSGNGCCNSSISDSYIITGAAKAWSTVVEVMSVSLTVAPLLLLTVVVVIPAVAMLVTGY